MSKRVRRLPAVPTRRKTKPPASESAAEAGAHAVIGAGERTAGNATQPAGSPGDLPAHSARFPIVGIGASAGGLAAFEAFFAGMPAHSDPGMAFVLVQHLAPDHHSILTELIGRYTRMQVREVEDGMVVQPNFTYIIPPGRDMALLNGALHLLEPAAPRGQRLPVDFFFRSLAQDQQERAIGIVLSGTGSDGTLGVRAIKGAGGMAMAQSPDSTEFNGMPGSAIATGLVDFALPPREMAARLMAFAAHAARTVPHAGAVPSPSAESALKKIFILLRAQTGHDFSLYKPSTVNRRVERRMAVHQIDGIDEYVKFLQTTPAEGDALFRDLLIGVTTFFRDPEVFQVLEQEVVPKLFAHRGADATVRVWSAGCSTGEEAYSLAILMAERIDATRQAFPVQLFATDIDRMAIATARAGVYPASIAADVSPERLARYFVAEADGSGYRIAKAIRDLVIFSEQDVIKDPPFSKLDLISCRNVLIYMRAELQKTLIPVFHYALRPGGVLLLGTSEGIGDHDEFFAVLDRKAKVYRRLGEKASIGRLSAMVTPPSTAGADALPPRVGRAVFPARQSVRAVTERLLLEHVVATGALVNSQGDILYLHGRTGLFLEPTPGEPGVSNIITMARHGLRHPLANALRTAVRAKQAVSRAGLRVKSNGHFTTTNLTVRPVLDAEGGSKEPSAYLVILEEASLNDAAEAARASTTALPDSDARVADLVRDLQAKEEYLQSANEELQTSSEELRSSHEEMQSVNEELQSTNEELETAKEEMQSVNEELATVNNELQAKVVDLSRAMDDMNNLLAGTGIGTVFVDLELRILRFTPAATAIMNLIPGDVGRPVAHVLSNLVAYQSLVADLHEVLTTLVPRSAEVQTAEGSWYLMRLQPYRTLHNVIEGAVISFTDVTASVRMQAALRKTNDQLRLAVVERGAPDALIVQDVTGRTMAWNPGAVRMYGWSEAEALQLNVRDRIPPGMREGALQELTRLSRQEVIEPSRSQRLTRSGDVVEVLVVATTLVDEAGQSYAIATTERISDGEGAP